MRGIILLSGLIFGLKSQPAISHQNPVVEKCTTQ